MSLGEAQDEIARRLHRLGPKTARYLATFACVLARVAHADLHVAQTESAEMRRRVAALAEISADEAALVVEIAEKQSHTLGESEKHAVTREFRRISGGEQRTELVFCLYAVAAADGKVSASETAEIAAICEELGVVRTAASGIQADKRFGATTG